MEIDKSFEDKSFIWLDKAFSGIISHYNENKSFFRNSEDTSYKKIYPTASLHCFNTYENFTQIQNTIFLEKVGNYKDKYEKLESIYECFDGFINQNTFCSLLGKSSHFNKTKQEGIKDLRKYVFIERYVSCLYTFKDEINLTFLFNNKKNQIVKYIDLDHVIKNDKLGASPLLLLKSILIIKKLKELNFDFFKQLNGEEYIEKFLAISKKHIDFHMARFSIDEETDFDATSLVLAIYSRSIIDKEWKSTSYFFKCLEVIMENQMHNGCWPSGVSVSFSKNADIVQLPSVEIACYILESLFDSSLLIDYNKSIEKRLKKVLPGLRLFSNFLELTYQKFKVKDHTYRGWSSDRLRHQDFTESWITSLTNRFYYLLWLTEKAYLRCQALNKLGLREFKSNRNKINIKEFWEKEFIEIDSKIKPIETIKTFCDGIKNNAINKHLCIPQKDKVSFILFGPSGGGKTTIIKKVAKALDWPVIELSPGHFIKNGLEFIETTSKELFDLISLTFHTVILFDECDELFRERKGENNQQRSILSFATASMLPKLQNLHDNRNVLFILNTNFVQNIDEAVRRKARFDELILIDRPDEKGRKSVIEKNSEDKSDDYIDTRIKETNGYSIKEIINYCQFDLKANIQEYIKWCEKTGPQELKFSGYDTTTIDQIESRWKQLIELLKKQNK